MLEEPQRPCTPSRTQNKYMFEYLAYVRKIVHTYALISIPFITRGAVWDTDYVSGSQVNRD